VEVEGASEPRASANERGVPAEGVGAGAAGVAGKGKSGTTGSGAKLPAKPAPERSEPKSCIGESCTVDAALAEDEFGWVVAVAVPLVPFAALRQAKEQGVGEAIFGAAMPPKQLFMMLIC
jgi:hypothetical protein